VGIIFIKAIERGVNNMFDKVTRRLLAAGLVGMGLVFLKRKSYPLRQRLVFWTENALLTLSKSMRERVHRIRV
jgi:hypothetical protein